MVRQLRSIDEIVIIRVVSSLPTNPIRSQGYRTRDCGFIRRHENGSHASGCFHRVRFSYFFIPLLLPL